jgi:hypothetical protein
MTTVVIMPGGFHPFHAGHLSLYNAARRAFPDADVYVAATNDTSTRPFPFAVKEKLAKLAGVESGRFVQVKSPFRAEEITSKYNPETDQLIFVRSEKDVNSQPRPGGTKKDGSPSYLQPYTADQELAPFNQHAYMAYLPTVEFGPGMTSATQIRTAWPTLTDRRKTALVMSLYPRTQNNAQLAATVVKLLDAAIGVETVAEGSDEDDEAPYHVRILDRQTKKVLADEEIGDWENAAVDRAEAYLAWAKTKGMDIVAQVYQPAYGKNYVTWQVPDEGNYDLEEQSVSEGYEPGDKITWYHSNHFPEIEGTVVGWKDGHLIVKSVDPWPRNTEKTVAKYRVPKNNILSHNKPGVAETVAANHTTADTAGAGAGMTAAYQRRENQPIAEDYLEERRGR